MADYDFRRELLDFHPRDIRDTSVEASSDEILLPDRIFICIDPSSEVIGTAAQDFVVYLERAMHITAAVGPACGNKFCVECLVADGLAPNSYRIEIADGGVRVTGASDRCVAQALYYLEFCMTERRAPVLSRKAVSLCMPFSPRMVHSGYGMGHFPDEYLSHLAHYGYDAVLVFVSGVNKTPTEALDFNDLTARARRYGIDVYAYCHIRNFTHPGDENAAEVFDACYGSIFKECPAIKGMVFVGESVEFRSNDPHVLKRGVRDKSPDNIPEHKPTPGWWPCADYADWISLVRDSVRRYRKDADIVFWTYNWGWAPEQDRLKLLYALPTDISLLVTFEMFQQYEAEGVRQTVTDYSLARAQAGGYFLSEARVAKERGLRLYAMTNTGGRTWDFGTTPYLPMPNQWQARYTDILRCHETFGLSGLMESHHFGLYPSFISRFAQLCFLQGGKYAESLDRALQAEFSHAHPKLKEGLDAWSEAIRMMPPTIEEQYGPFRVGTAYPLCLIKAVQPPDYEGSHFGSRIWSSIYGQFEGGLVLGFSDPGLPYALRHAAELRMLEGMRRLMDAGLKKICAVTCKNEAFNRLISLGRHIRACVQTAIHAKKFAQLRLALKCAGTPQGLQKTAQSIRRIAERELKNARESIAYSEQDSRIGFEPSMHYVCNKARIEWKIRQVEYMLAHELPYYEQAK